MLSSDYPFGVVGRWMSRGTEGIRLDVADEIPDEVLERIRFVTKAANNDAVIIGEVWEDATTKFSYGSLRTYALGKSLDSVMNYPLRDALIRFAICENSAVELVNFLQRQKLNYPPPLYESLMNLLSSHDVERIRSVLAAGFEFRSLARFEQYEIAYNIDNQADICGAILQQILATALYSLPGVPCLYYGDERGMQGGRDPFDRATFPWNGPRNDCGLDLTSFYQELGKLRNNFLPMRCGEAAFYSHGKDVVCILRVCPEENEAALCILNRHDSDLRFGIDLVDESSGLSDKSIAFLKHSDLKTKAVFSTQNETVISDIGSEAINNSILDGIFICFVSSMSASIFRICDSSDAEVQQSLHAACASAKKPAIQDDRQNEDKSDMYKFAKTLPSGAGVICHLTSIPKDFSFVEDDPISLTGGLGDSSLQFVDKLNELGFKYWQLLPLNPTDQYGSPYAGLSAFAGNTLLISSCNALKPSAEALESYIQNNKEWLLPYATFTAIKEVMGGTDWQDWPEKYRKWNESVARLPELSALVQDEIRNQFEFDRQWGELKHYANERGISIIGDMPIYVSVDSADVWAHPEYFMLDKDGRVDIQSGVPPDQFASEGQLWGNPTYNWEALKENGYKWWMQRFKRLFDLYDFVRLDHFIGLSTYYAIESGRSAQEGKWLKGPGIDLFKQAFEKFGPLPLIAEDLGVYSPETQDLLAKTGFLGMDVIQFFDGNPLEHWRAAPAKIVYTSTHDTSTLLGWVKTRYALDGTAAIETMRKLKKMALESGADIVMLSLQDILELDDSARMNIPGTTENNWKWQASHFDINRI